MMTNTTIACDERQTKKCWLDWFGKLFTTLAKPENEKQLSPEELEKLDRLLKLKEADRIRKQSLVGLSIEDFIYRKW